VVLVIGFATGISQGAAANNQDDDLSIKVGEAMIHIYNLKKHSGWLARALRKRTYVAGDPIHVNCVSLQDFQAFVECVSFDRVCEVPRDEPSTALLDRLELARNLEIAKLTEDSFRLLVKVVV